MARRYGSDGDVDRRLREVLDPGPGQAGRVARAALRARDAPSFRRRAVALLAAAAAVAVALGMWLQAAGPRSPRPEEPPSSARYSLHNRNEVLVVRNLDGGTAFLQAGERSQEPPAGMIFIVRGRSAS